MGGPINVILAREHQHARLSRRQPFLVFFVSLGRHYAVLQRTTLIPIAGSKFHLNIALVLVKQFLVVFQRMRIEPEDLAYALELLCKIVLLQLYGNT